MERKTNEESKVKGKNTYKDKLEPYSKLIGKIENHRKETVNVFKVLNLENFEIRHSSMLAWLMDRNGNHGLGNRFLEDFFSECFGDSGVDFSKEFVVYTEYPVSIFKDGKTIKGRSDIFIEGADFTCTIENKYGSLTHDDQLQTYRTWIKNHYDSDKYKNLFIFLDVYISDDYDNTQGEFEEYQPISYEQVYNIISNILNDKKIEINDKVRQILCDYKDVVYEKLNPQVVLENLISDEDLSLEMLDIINDIDEESDLFIKLDRATKDFVLLMKDYMKYKREKCNKGVEKILQNILAYKTYVVKEEQINASGKSKKIKKDIAVKPITVYANHGLAIDLKYKDSKYNKYLNTIDIPCLTSVNIFFIAGLHKSLSKNLLMYIKDNKINVFNRMSEMKDAGWNFYFKLTLFNAAGGKRADSSTIADIKCNVTEENIDKIVEVLLNKEDQKIKRFHFYPEKRMKELFDTIEKLNGIEGLFDKNEYNSFCKNLKDKESMTSEGKRDYYLQQVKEAKAKGTEFRGVNNQEGYIYVGGDFVFSMGMIYKSNLKTVDENNSNEVEELIKVRTTEGMEVFNYNTFKHDTYL